VASKDGESAFSLFLPLPVFAFGNTKRFSESPGGASFFIAKIFIYPQI
jgi:hypothetical protein